MNTSLTTPLLLQGDGYSIVITPDALKKKESLIQYASQITEVTDNDSANLAKSAMKDVNDMMIAVEKSRKEVKAPVLQVGDKIDTAAKEFVKELDAQKSRLNKLVTDHAAEQARLQREALERQRRAQEAGESLDDMALPGIKIIESFKVSTR